jgi:poly(3-hydroxybutyrate) depolymerase
MTDTRTEDMENSGRSTPRQRAIDAYGSARERVSGAGRRAGGALDEAPLVALAAGLAAGAAIAALLPRTRTEDRLLRPVTDRARETAQSAYQAAKDAGRERLDELGLTKDRGSEAIRSIIDGARDAAKTSAQAAVGTYRKGE